MCAGELLAQQKGRMELSLDNTIRLACEQSPDARSAAHTYRSAFWNYKYYEANYLPSLTLSSAPTLNRMINRVTMDNGSEKFIEQNILNADLAFSIEQNVSLTGGTFFIETSTQRVDLLDDKTHSWQTSPVTVGYKQSLFGYNSLKWNRRIEPVRYQKAKKAYIETIELIAVEATTRFFNLATAQSDLEMAQSNYNNADTLYHYAQGRYNIGTITENEMLQLELNKLSEETNLMNARIECENAVQSLRSYLGIRDDVQLKVMINQELPEFQVPIDEALFYANENSPDKQNMLLRKLESESTVAQAKANAGLKADIYLRFGLTQTASKLKNAYRDPLDQQYVSLSVTLPILDWGRGRGQIQVARSNRDLVYTQVDQAQIDFDLNVRKLVDQFNLQRHKVKVAARTDSTAQRRNNVAYKLYLLGKSTVLDLNASITEKNKAKQNYLSSLYIYWSLYYTLRSITLFDFVDRCPLVEKPMTEIVNINNSNNGY